MTLQLPVNIGHLKEEMPMEDSFLPVLAAFLTAL